MATKKPRKGKFLFRYERPDGYKAEISGDIPIEPKGTRAARLCDMFSAVAMYGEDTVTGFKEVLDRYIVDYDARVAETEAKKAGT